MKGGAIWMTGLIILLFSFCALQFRAIQRAQRTAADQNAKLSETVQSIEGLVMGAGRPKAPAAAEATGKSLESVILDLQNFMRDMRSRQSGVEKRLTDLDERIDREREMFLGDIRSFVADMRSERRELTNEIDRLRAETSGGALPQAQQIVELLNRLDEKISEVAMSLMEESKRRDAVLQQETEGAKITGTVSGPGEDTRRRY